jgi:MFS family permease
VVFGGPERTRVIVVLAGVLAMSSADAATVGAAATQLRRSLHIDLTDVGLLVTVSSIVAALASVPFGVIADRFKRTRTLGLTVLLWGVAMIASALSGSFAELLLARLFLGIVTASAGPVVASMIGDYFPSGERGRVYSYILTGELAGAGVGFAVTGDIAALSWRAAFVVLALPTFFLARALFRLPEPTRGGLRPLPRDDEPPVADTRPAPPADPTGTVRPDPRTRPDGRLGPDETRRPGATRRAPAGYPAQPASLPAPYDPATYDPAPYDPAPYDPAPYDPYPYPAVGWDQPPPAAPGLGVAPDDPRFTWPPDETAAVGRSEADPVPRTEQEADTEAGTNVNETDAQRVAREKNIQPDTDRILLKDPRTIGLWEATRYVLSIRTNVILIIASACSYFYLSGIETFASEFTSEQYGVPQALANILILVVGVGAVIGVLVGGALSDNLLRRRFLNSRILVAGTAAILTSLLFVPAILTRSTITALPYLTLAGFALMAQNPAIDAARLDIVPPLLWGRAEGIRTLLRTLAQSLAPVLFGAFADLLGGKRIGLQWTFLVMLLPLLANGVILLLALRTYPRDVATAAAAPPPRP